MPLEVQVVSPERVLFEGEADMVVCRPADGDIAFLPGHVPFLGALGDRPGAHPAARRRRGQAVAVHGGFVEVSNDHVVVLSDVAELPEQIDVGACRRPPRRAPRRPSAATATTRRPRPQLRRADTRILVATEL